MFDYLAIIITVLSFLCLFIGIKFNEKRKSRNFILTPGGRAILVGCYLSILNLAVMLINIFV